MRDNFYKRAEFLANVAIVVVALLLAGVLAKRFLFDKREETSTTAANYQVPAGTRVPLADVDWARNRRTLLLVLQRGCHFCAESAPFYQRLAREADDAAVRLVAVLPQEVTESRQYLAELHVPVSEVRQSTLGAVGVRGTPTLLLVDSQGVVEDSWVGKLSTEREEQVLRRLQADPAAVK